MAHRLAIALALVGFSVLASGAVHTEVRQALNRDCPLAAVCFAIDHSSSIRGLNFPREVDFVTGAATQLSNVATNLQYSAVRFATSAAVVEPGTSSLADFIATVQAEPQSGGRTNLEQALLRCFNLIQGVNGIRIILLITDGMRTEGGDPIPAANQIKANPDTFIGTVGIGPAVNGAALTAIASTPDLFFPTSFTDLDALVDVLVDEVCEEIEEDGCAEAFEQCDFTFENANGLQTFPLPITPDVPFTSRVVSKSANETLGVLNTNDIIPEFIFPDGTATNITQFGSQPFTPTHFKPFFFKNTSGSAIGHQTFQGDQFAVAKDKCIRIHFTSYQLLSAQTGLVTQNFNNVMRSMNKCVVFRTE